MTRMTFSIVLFFSLSATASDPWEMAFEAKEQMLLGQPEKAERLLRAVKNQLVRSEKNEMDWELLKWVEDEIQHSRQAQSQKESLPLSGQASSPAPMKAKSWSRTGWVLLGGGALLALWLNHEINQSQRKHSPVVTEGFLP